MRNIWLLASLMLPFSVFAQSKFDYEHYNNITPIEGTEYVYATAEHEGKKSTDNQFLLFINAKTGETRKVEFPAKSMILSINRLKYDSLDIDKFLLTAKTVDLNDRAGINYNDPTQIILLSIDGKDKQVITEDGYFVTKWYVSPVYGTLIVLGYYDSNNNGRRDYSDKAETLVYDIKKMKVLSKG